MLENTKNLDTAGQIIVEWDEALVSKDVERLLKLYAPDATLESPLICHLLNQASGICMGSDELRNIFELFAKNGIDLPKLKEKSNYFTDGTMIMWECPRVAPNGEQMDFVEVIKLHNGLIQNHRVYWGWQNANVLKNVCDD